MSRDNTIYGYARYASDDSNRSLHFLTSTLKQLGCQEILIDVDNRLNDLMTLLAGVKPGDTVILLTVYDMCFTDGDFVFDGFKVLRILQSLDINLHIMDVDYTKGSCPTVTRAFDDDVEKMFTDNSLTAG